MSQVQKFNMQTDFLCNYSIHSQETAARQLIKECIPNCYQFEISSKLKQTVFISISKESLCQENGFFFYFCLDTSYFIKCVPMDSKLFNLL